MNKIIKAKGNEALKNETVVFQVSKRMIYVASHGKDTWSLVNRSYNLYPVMGRDFQKNRNFRIKWIDNLVDSPEKWELLHILKNARINNK